MKNNAIVYFVGAIVFILLIWIGSSIIDFTDSGDSTVVGIIAIIVFACVFPMIALSLGVFANKKVADYKEHLSEQKDLNATVQGVKEELSSYETYKYSFKLCSNQFLVDSYKEFKKNQVESMEVLAIEEEMVNRALLDHSPMHQKLILIKRQIK